MKSDEFDQDGGSISLNHHYSQRQRWYAMLKTYGAGFFSGFFLCYLALLLLAGGIDHIAYVRDVGFSAAIIALVVIALLWHLRETTETMRKQRALPRDNQSQTEANHSWCI